MGIADARDAFQAGIGSAGSCIGARLDYIDGGGRQRLSFDVVSPRHAGTVTVVEECSADADLQQVSRAAAERWAKT